ncbi:HpcH/HpaI aldolase/citrate lyase family protein [Microbacterium album]|uniref:Citrate lyase subunit beta-like protein n=1 Tax=Microbacterium album TaxID=2053191 RepID=A0A917IHC2_9MICO|nr:CoA ester lyase [Microbacterium album]GGH47017.1 citrate lyase subunit beta-like protein [Microbacterium album]
MSRERSDVTGEESPTKTVAWLFCPADRPERYAKAAAAADAVILDLEDGVAPERRDEARAALRARAPGLDPATTIVRINPHGTPEQARDLSALEGTGLARIMLAKTESADQLAALAGLEVVALCETPLGVARADEIAAAAAAVMWGAEDLMAGLGGMSSRAPDGSWLDVVRYARSRVLIAAGAAGVPALDAVYPALEDLDGLRVEAADAARSGFAGKVALHPRQVPVIREAFRPDEVRVAWARAVLDAAAHSGAQRVGGEMIDEPLLRQARRVLAAAG